jgi:hypothetical protein
MYCLHSLKQDLLLVSEFSFNKSYPHLIVNEYGQSIQPFCKESKKIFVNENSNKKRTSDQHVEGSQGSRTRGLVTALCYGENVPTGEELFKKFGGVPIRVKFSTLMIEVVGKKTILCQLRRIIH